MPALVVTRRSTRAAGATTDSKPAVTAQDRVGLLGTPFQIEGVSFNVLEERIGSLMLANERERPVRVDNHVASHERRTRLAQRVGCLGNLTGIVAVRGRPGVCHRCLRCWVAQRTRGVAVTRVRGLPATPTGQRMLPLHGG